MYVLLLFPIYLLFILTISVKPILKNLAYQTDLVQIVLVGRTMSVDDQSEISLFFDPSRDVATATNFWWFYP